MRIVAAAPNIEEIVTALGLDDALVGVGMQSTRRDLPVVGGLFVDAERVLSLHPTHVVILLSQETPTLTEASSMDDFQLISLQCRTLDDIAGAIEGLGTVFHRGKRGRELARQVRSIYASLPPIRSLYVIWWDPLILSGEGQFTSQLLERLGLQVITPGHGNYPRITVEEILALNPELILYADDAGPPPSRLLSLSPAPFVSVDADLLNRPGPSLLDAVTQITEKLIPLLNERSIRNGVPGRRPESLQPAPAP